MLIPALLFLLSAVAPQATTDWCGIDISKPYVTEGQTQIAFVFEPDNRRVFASLFNEKPLGIHALGYLADVSVVDPKIGTYAVDIVWDESHGELLRSQSIIIIDRGEVLLDGSQQLVQSNTIDSSMVMFTEATPAVAKARRLNVSALDMFATRYYRIDKRIDYLMVLPSSRRVALANGEDNEDLARGWILPTAKEGSWRILWDDPATAPDKGARFSELRMVGENIGLRVQRHRQALFRKQEIGSSTMGDQRSQKIRALQSQLFQWSDTQAASAERWNGWLTRGVYKLESAYGMDDTFIWVEPDTMEAFLATVFLDQLVKDSSARGRIVNIGQLLDGSYVTDIVWDDNYHRRTFRVVGDKVYDMGSEDTYELSQDARMQELSKYFTSALPQAELSAEDFPYLEPGSVFKGGKRGTAYIFVLENGRDVLIGSGGNGMFDCRGVLVQSNGAADDKGYRMEFVEYPGKEGRQRSGASWHREGDVLDLQSDQMASGRFELLPEGAAAVLSGLKSKYGFWVED